ncbi:MAG: hypothetical protein EP330_08115 [Deltaproteobacteria bacterium]|nr:MAG: hypothetical protein EP330_08115 [Deltaproteobacteria bacterium]
MRLLALPLLALVACDFDQTVEFDTVVLDGSYDSVRIDLDAGDVRVAVADVDQIQIERTLRYRQTRPEPVAEVASGELFLGVRCTGCSVDHVVLIPESAPIAALTGAGDMEFRRLSHTLSAATAAGRIGLLDHGATADLHSSAGDLEVDGLDGSLFARADAGRIDVVGARAAEVEVSSGAGDLSLVLEGFPQFVSAFASAGAVELELPGGAYALEATADAGDVQVRGLTQDASAARRIEVRSAAGDVTVIGR